MPLQTLTAPPTAPARTNPPDTFISRADAFVAWLATFRSEMTTLTAQLEATAALIAAAPAYADTLLKTIADSNLIPAADRGVYFTSGSVAALFTLTAYGRTLAALADAAAGRTALGLVIGTDVQAFDADLAAIAALATTSFGRSVLTQADAAALRSLAGLGTAATADSSQLVPAGTVITVAMNSAPTGYLKCNGAAVSRTTYAALFTAIGTTYGVGDGSTTFNVPELRGEFVRGWDDARGVDSGRAIGSAQADDLKAHTHTDTSVIDGGGGKPGGAGGQNTTLTTGSTGGAETRPRNVALLYCIKT